ncbi:MAG: glycosyltransferase [Chitinophagales bacterium]
MQQAYDHLKKTTPKIIFTVTNDLNYDQRMQRICNSLQNNGFEVLLVGRERKNSKPLKKQAFQQKRLKCWFNRNFLFYAEYNIRLWFFLLFNKYSVVCGIDLDTLPAAYFSALVKFKKCVYDAHEYFPEIPELQGRRGVKLFWTRIERFLLPKVARIYTVSHGIKEIFEKRYKREVELIRNLPHLKVVSKQSFEHEYIIYQGALNVGRGLETLISIMPQINAQLWLAGEGDLSDELRSLASKNFSKEDSSKIKFLGKIDPKDLKQITANAALGINLLEPMGESYFHSLSNKFFDYTMAAIPQVCIDFPEYQRLNEEHEVAVLVADLDPQKLVSCINDLLQNHALREPLIANCKVARTEWNWEHEEKHLIEIYNQLV